MLVKPSKLPFCKWFILFQSCNLLLLCLHGSHNLLVLVLNICVYPICFVYGKYRLEIEFERK